MGAADKYVAVEVYDALTSRLLHYALNLHSVARYNLVVEANVVDAEKVGRVVLGILLLVQHAQRAALRHSLDDEHTRHNRLAREVALEEWLVEGYLLDTRD